MAESEENWYLDLRSEMFIIEIGGLDHMLEKALLVDTRVIFMEFKTNQVLWYETLIDNILLQIYCEFYIVNLVQLMYSMFIVIHLTIWNCRFIKVRSIWMG